jgi:hypothetical protein
MSEITDWITAIATAFSTVGIGLAYSQLRMSQKIAQLQFEDSITKEYRDLVNRLPTKALLGATLSDREYQKAFDELFHYIDLSNEQVFLRQKGRIGIDAWKNWSDGIQHNLRLSAFDRAWHEIKEASNSKEYESLKSFQELRQLEQNNFKDPRNALKKYSETFLCKMMKKIIVFWQLIRKFFVCTVCLLLFNGAVYAKSPQEIQKLQIATSQGDAKTQYEFGIMCYTECYDSITGAWGEFFISQLDPPYYGDDVKQNYVEAVKWFRLAADQGYPEAQNTLAWMYEIGKGVKQNYAEAETWYRLAAKQGDSSAQNNLKLMYENNRRIRYSYAENVKCFLLAAAQGDVKAQRNLGVAYANGQGVERNDSEAVKWYRLAATNSDSWAQSYLGEMYEKGYGVEQDYAEAIKWYRLAAIQGNVNGQFNLGVIYGNGKSVRQNHAEAIKWFLLAAQQGSVGAQFNLGVVYNNGYGVKQNKAIAKEWFGKACDNGYQAGCDEYRKLNIPTKIR